LNKLVIFERNGREEMDSRAKEDETTRSDNRKKKEVGDWMQKEKWEVR
jgi:hypothetical protein